MNGKILKSTLREIKSSLGRFLSILFIIAIGIAFFVGVKVSSPTMEHTANKYYVDNNLYDIQVISNLGLDNDDVEAIGRLNNVESVDGRKTKDFIVPYDGMELTVRLHGEDFNSIQSKDYINKPKIVEGRLPSSPNECVIEYSHTLNIKVGDTIKLKTPNSEDIKDFLKYDEYKVVGKVMMPNYISHQKGSTSIGSGTLNTFMLVDEENFISDIFTECLIKIKNPTNYSNYSSEYKSLVSSVSKEVEGISKERASLRYDKVIGDGLNKIKEGEEKLASEKKKAYTKLEEGKNQILSGEKAIETGEEKISTQEENLNKAKINGNIALDKSEEELQGKEESLSIKYNKFLQDKPTIEKSIQEDKQKVVGLTTQRDGLTSKIKTLEDKLLSENITEEEKETINSEIGKYKNELSTIEKNISSLNVAIEYKSVKLAESEKGFLLGFESISSGKSKIKEERNKLNKLISEGTAKIAEAKENLENAKKKIKLSKEEYNKGKEKADSSFKEAEVDIKNAKAKLNDIKSGKWYVLDRESNYGIVEYGNSSNSISSISKVFPIFFFLVAALICVTTMTRMIDEQRTTIGTLKALGYGKLSIMMKYIIYSSLASILGSILGIIIGISIFPSVIFNAYASMTFIIPSMSLSVAPSTIITGMIISVGTTLIATIASCYKELAEMPGLLMRPKPPKNGKRIFLERISFIWSRLSFIQKVTIRNLFRYKKRFAMTVIGIAGCSALVLSGFGIRDSIGSIVDKQYQEVFKYDGSINYKKEVVKGDINSDIQKTFEKYGVSQYENVRIKKMEFSNLSNIKKEGNIFVLEDSKNIDKFVNLKSRGGESYSIDNNGVIITEKLAKLLNIKVGDSFYVEGEDKSKNKIKVSGIVENYVDHYVYMSSDLYKSVFNQEVKYNQMIFTLNNLSNANQEKLSSDLSKDEDVGSVSYNYTIKETFDSMISSLKYIVLVMILSAGALAFVVLYNLTNVNISERIREIATIKVLGFYDREVSSYVFRENIILTVIGGLVGLFLGVGLHRFIMLTAELDLIMFGRNISLLSYVYSLLITVGFSLIVNGFMYFKLQKIKMVESLKSVE
ncbi:MAG: FtsX-like permease family protein [Clostridium sp.]